MLFISLVLIVFGNEGSSLTPPRERSPSPTDQLRPLDDDDEATNFPSDMLLSPDPWEFTSSYRERVEPSNSPLSMTREQDLSPKEGDSQPQDLFTPSGSRRGISPSLLLCNKEMSSNDAPRPFTCAGCSEASARQGLRDYKLHQFIQTFEPVPTTSMSTLTLGSVREARWDLGDLLWLLNHIIAAGTLQEQLRMAIPLWSLISFTLESILVSCNERMDDFRRRQMHEEPARADVEPPSSVNCRVCLVGLPTVAIRSCGHVFCVNCAERLFRCPLCRRPIVGRQNLFF